MDQQVQNLPGAQCCSHSLERHESIPMTWKFPLTTTRPSWVLRTHPTPSSRTVRSALAFT